MAAPTVPERALGKQGLVTSALGLGCMGMSAFYGPPTEEGQALAVIHRALELGVTLLDTSDIYGPFTNEELVGRAVKGRRGKYTIATKCGIALGAEGMRYDGSRAHVRAACEASLERLGVETIDLYYLHRVDPNTPVSETFAEMKALQAEGKVRHVGISEASPDDIRAAHAVTPLSAVQLEWSLWSRDVEEDIVPVCRELGIGIVAYSPLGRGFLTGAMPPPAELAEGDYRRNTPRFKAYEKNLALVDKVKEVAAAKGCTPAQLALAWVLAQGVDVVPIPGTTKVARLEENAGALSIELGPAELAALEELSSLVVGDRYANMKETSYHYGRK